MLAEILLLICIVAVFVILFRPRPRRYTNTATKIYYNGRSQSYVRSL